MSKKKGLSAEEKKTRMLQIFYETKDFFQLKELEKIAPKEKGITSQSVKEVIQHLVDDHLVDSEKIGTSIYFWAFPSKAKHTKKRKVAQLESEAAESARKLLRLQEAASAETVGREENEERKLLLTELDKVLREEDRLKKELQKYRDCDPEYIEQLKGDIDSLKAAINRWTENIFILKSYCKNKFNIEDSTLDKSFGIPPELDYIE